MFKEDDLTPLEKIIFGNYFTSSREKFLSSREETLKRRGLQL
jgi:hypothetical protein